MNSIKLEIMNKKRREIKVVFTNGIYDIMHLGHFQILQFAKSLGDKLVVGINSDRSTKELKGPTRPINTEEVRRTNLLALHYVDEVVIFDEIRTAKVIKRVHPNIVVKGGEWTPEKVREIDGIPPEIEVVVCPLVLKPSGEKYSTTSIIEEMNGKKS